MKVVNSKKTVTIEFDKIELQALANFIGPTSHRDRTERWGISLGQSRSLSVLYELLCENGIISERFVDDLFIREEN